MYIYRTAYVYIYVYIAALLYVCIDRPRDFLLAIGTRPVADWQIRYWERFFAFRTTHTSRGPLRWLARSLVSSPNLFYERHYIGKGVN